MEIQATSEKDFITKYVTLLGVLSHFNKRETEVAVVLVMVYRKIRLAKSKQDEDTPEEDVITSVMDTLKGSETLHSIAKYLDMPFTSFRNYVSKLKAKRFFVEGDINPIFVPEGMDGNITISYVKTKV